MVDFIHTLTVERPFGEDVDVDPGADLDDWGQPILTYDDFATIPALIQPKKADEQPLVSQGGAEIGDHVIYTPRGDITNRDRLLDVTTGGSGYRYEIVGIRDYNFGALAHFAIDARRVTSPALEIGS